jgi:hypothetical protein
MSSFNKCAKEGCNGKVMKYLKHKFCVYHRPKLVGKVYSKTRSGDKEKESRRRAAAGIPTWW